jgi:hypothetical protein
MVGGSAVTAAAAPVLSHSPAEDLHIGATGWTAPNWSGYAGTTSNATEINGNWTVPSVSKTSGNTYSSSWIGIDGFTNDDLIQTGTEQDWYGGKAHYDAWWEILPAAETIITGKTVKPGDSMTAEISPSGTAGVWLIFIEDITEHWDFSIDKSYSGPADSVEWIQEATTINGKIATEAHYSEYTWTNLDFDGGTVDLGLGNRGVMIQKGKHVSTPSHPGNAPTNNAFTMEYGAKTPPPPG